VLCLLVIFFVAWFLWRHHIRNKYRSNALQWKEQDLPSNGNYNALVYETIMLMKRIAMTKYGRNNVAGKRSNEFMVYINSTWKAQAFDETDKALFSDIIYRPENIEEDKAAAFVNKAKQWIKQHV